MSTNYEKEQAEARRQLEERISKRAVENQKAKIEEEERRLEGIARIKSIEKMNNANEKKYESDSVLIQFGGFFLFLGVIGFMFMPFLAVPSMLIGGVLYLIDYNKKHNLIGQVKDKSISVVDDTKNKISPIQKTKEPNPDELLKWYDLKDKGVITEEEFEVHKKRILG